MEKYLYKLDDTDVCSQFEKIRKWADPQKGRVSFCVCTEFDKDHVPVKGNNIIQGDPVNMAVMLALSVSRTPVLELVLKTALEILEDGRNGTKYEPKAQV